MADEQEVWRPYDATYEVSNLGNVRNIKTQQYRTISINPRSGYATVNIKRNSENVNHYVHRMVAIAFKLERRPDQVCVDHQNRERANNRLENLRWVTYKENLANRSPPAPRKTNTGHFHVVRHTKTVQSKKKGEVTYTYYTFGYKDVYKNFKTEKEAIDARDAYMATLTPAQPAQS
jgi:hypothetical protein